MLKMKALVTKDCLKIPKKKNKKGRGLSLLAASSWWPID